MSEPSNEATDILDADEAEGQLGWIRKALDATENADRDAALAEGFARYGLRFAWGIGYWADCAEHRGPFEELKAISIEVLTRWIGGRKLTPRADEEERRAQVGVELITSGFLPRLGAKCLMALPEGHPQRDLSRVSEALQIAWDGAEKDGDVDMQLRVIADRLEYDLEPADRALQSIEEGERRVTQVDSDCRHDFRVAVCGWYLVRAIRAKDANESHAQYRFASHGLTVLEKMRAEEPEFFRQPKGINLLAAVTALSDQPDAALELFASAVDGLNPQDPSYLLAATIEARYRTDRGEWDRVIKILSPVVERAEEAYLTAVEDSAVLESGNIFSEVVWALAFASAATGRWAEAIEHLERGKSRRLRYQAALRQSPEGKRLLDLEAQLYAVSRGVAVDGTNVPAARRAEDRLSKKLSFATRLLEEYRALRPKLSPVLRTMPAIRDIAGQLACNEAVVILGVIRRADTLIAVILPGDSAEPSGRFVLREWPLRAWVPFFAGENEDGWLYVLGAPEKKVDAAAALERVLTGADKIIGKKLAAFFEAHGVQHVTMIGHGWLHALPWWAVPSLAKYEIVLAASAAQWAGARRRPVARRSALLVANPTGDLPLAGAEASFVERRLANVGFTVTRLDGLQATESATTAALDGATLFHFCGHGRSDTDRPTRSALLLHPDLAGLPASVPPGPDPLGALAAGITQWQDGQDEERHAAIPGVGLLREQAGDTRVERWLDYAASGTLWTQSREGQLLRTAELWTAGDIFSRHAFDDCRLGFLSACEVGMGGIDFERDESSGLPAALQLAGVPTIISSLWPVSDALAALHVDLIYEALVPMLPKANIAAAVSRAQKQLREMTKADAAAHLRRLHGWTKSGRGRFMLEAFAAQIAGADDERPFANPYHWATFHVTGSHWLELASTL